MLQTALIFGIMGACRRQELYNLQFKDVQVFETTILVNIYNTKTKISRSFSITGCYYEVCKKYIELRPNPCSSPYFFLNFQAGKCTTQRIGINKFGYLGKVIANYLDLPNPELFTGHCFRRTSATLLVDSGGDITTLKRHGGWKSTTVAEGYIDESIANKIQVSNQILNSIEKNTLNINIPSTSTINAREGSVPSANITFNNCTIQNVNNYYNKQ